MPTGVNRTKLIGQAAAYAGYSLVLLGEGMCSAAINVGPELTPAQLFAEAKIRFDSAIVAATTANDAATLNLATLGRARTLLDLGQRGRGRRRTRRRFPLASSRTLSTDARERAARELRRSSRSIRTAWSTVDPIVPRPDDQRRARSARRGHEHGPQRARRRARRSGRADKYPALATVMPIARYAEAQLIVAEAQARGE